MRYWLLALVLAAGCASQSGDTGIPITGRAADTRKMAVIHPRQSWEDRCWLPSQAEIRKKLVNPASGRFQQAPSFEAYFDKERDTTILTVKGVVTSKGNYGQAYTQDFYVTWEQQGDLAEQDASPDAWQLGDVVVFPSRGGT